jgi:uracil-DNA glycosylase
MISDNKISEIDALKQQVSVCTRCKLHTTRTQTVFGEGSYDAQVMFIGEGPGKDEDIQGRPFVGRAGQLLTAIIEKGMKIPRSSVFIANMVKCRPTVDMKFERDRPPDDEEVQSCCDYLKQQILLIKPKVIITLGNPSTRFILKTKEGITKMRGAWGSYEGIPVMPTYHPSFILRNGGDSSPQKRDVWEDIKKVLHFFETGDVGEVPTHISYSLNNEPPVLKESSVKEKEQQGKLF